MSADSFFSSGEISRLVNPQLDEPREFAMSADWFSDFEAAFKALAEAIAEARAEESELVHRETRLSQRLTTGVHNQDE